MLEGQLQKGKPGTGPRQSYMRVAIFKVAMRSMGYAWCHPVLHIRLLCCPLQFQVAMWSMGFAWCPVMEDLAVSGSLVLFWWRHLHP